LGGTGGLKTPEWLRIAYYVVMCACMPMATATYLVHEFGHPSPHQLPMDPAGQNDQALADYTWWLAAFTLLLVAIAAIQAGFFCGNSA
jgi:hypothetical protein